MNLLRTIRNLYNRATPRKVSPGHLYQGSIIITMSGTFIRRINLKLRAHTRRQAEAKLQQRIADELSIETKVHRIKNSLHHGEP